MAGSARRDGREGQKGCEHLLETSPTPRGPNKRHNCTQPWRATTFRLHLDAF